jgi:hypothetical protein
MASPARPPGLTARPPTGRPPKRPARLSRLGPKSAQLAAGGHARSRSSICTGHDRTGALGFRWDKNPSGTPLKTPAHFSLTLSRIATWTGGSGVAPWLASAGHGDGAAPPGPRPPATPLSSLSFLCFLFLPLFPSPKKPESTRDRSPPTATWRRRWRRRRGPSRR